jgi:hypothetical protein
LDRLPDPASADLERLWDKGWRKALLERAVLRVKKRVPARPWQMYDLSMLKRWPALDVARHLQVNVARVYLAKRRIGGLIRNELQRLQPPTSGRIRFAGHGWLAKRRYHANDCYLTWLSLPPYF